MRTVFAIVLAAFMVSAGIFHFLRPEPFIRIVPKMLPEPRMLVYVSGVFEIVLGLGLLHPATQRFAAWGLIALFIAIFPANVNMAVHGIAMGARPLAPWMAWGRLPLQAVLIAWAWWFTR